MKTKFKSFTLGRLFGLVAMVGLASNAVIAQEHDAAALDKLAEEAQMALEDRVLAEYKKKQQEEAEVVRIPANESKQRVTRMIEPTEVLEE